jgi:hypothetical protein
MVAITTRAGKGSPLTNAELDANFTGLNGGLTGGNVVGPAAATDNAIARYDTITGKLLQDSLASVDDTGAIIAGAHVSATTLTLRRSAGGISFFHDASPAARKWQVATEGAESGANAGSDIAFYNYSDAGAWIGTPLLIRRASGDVIAQGNIYGSSILASGMVRAGPAARVALEQTGQNGDVVLDTSANTRLRSDWADGTLYWIVNGAVKMTVTAAGNLSVVGELQAAGYVRAQGYVAKSEIIYTDALGIARHTIRMSASALEDSPTPLAGDAGQNLQFIVYSDAGAELGTPLRIDRVGGGSVNITTLNVSGPATFGAGVNAASLVIRAGPMIHATAGGVTRWTFEFLGGPQNWSLNRFNDAGVWQGSALIVDRATGDATFGGEITFGAGADKVELRGRYYRINALSAVASYGFLLADQGSLVRIDWGAAIVATIPAEAAQNFPIGTRIDVVQWGTGQLSIAPDVGVTLQSAGGKRKFTGQFSGASLTKIATNYWLLVGDLTA